MKRYKFKLTLFAVLLIVFSSCEDFLDRKPEVDYTNDGFYRSDAALEYGLNGAFNAIYWVEFQGGNATLPWYILLDHYTGMAIERTENSSLGAGGGIDPSNGTLTYAWIMPYTTIATCNSIIDGAKPFMNNFTVVGKSYLAELRVLRAWAYYHLAYVFGDVVLYKETPQTDHYYPEKSPQKDVIDFALEDLDAAIADLEYNKVANKRLGHVDKSVALGLKARIALNAGSLNIGGDGAKYFGIARDAAKKVIDESGRGLNPKFDDLFLRQGQINNTNNEIMFQLMYSDQQAKKYHYVGLGQVSRMYGQTGRFPSQMLVDQYECKDGKRIDESLLYNPQKPWENRDSRLHSTIWMQGDTITGNNGGNLVTFVFDVFRDSTSQFNYTTQQWRNVVNLDIVGFGANYGPAKNGVGYLWKKYCNEKDENIWQSTLDIVLMRYSEILLTYAEAKIELNELDNSVYDAINRVRERAGQPEVSADRKGDIDKMRQLVRRERKVELMIEGLHFFDMRRWKIGDIENAEPTYGYPVATLEGGMKIVSGGYENVTPDMIPDFKTSTKADLNDIPAYKAYASKLKVRDANRYWNDRFYLWPVPQQELDKNRNLTQNQNYK